MTETNILLTGATGFVGQALLKQLLKSGVHCVTATVRTSIGFDSCEVVPVGDIDNTTEWSNALTNQQVVIHAAARAHIMKDEMSDPLAEYRRVNVGGTLNLARQAATAGVKRFIFMSSVKVNGEQTPLGQPFRADDMATPEDAYGISKWEAEQGLNTIAVETGMEVVIVRPPLVYGPNVKGNFDNMIRLVEKGLPLPLGAIHNQRSLVALDNLVDFIITCIDHPAASNQVFLAGDGQDLSTTELLRGVAKAAGKPSRLIPIPSSLLMFIATFLGKKAVAQRLLGSLQVDISKARELLGWEPPISVEEGFRRCFIKD
jgi:nucleoside-diphosphate-sugar epimerase